MTTTELREKINEVVERDSKKTLLKFSTAGSVDDGKSTLIGRLLYDSKNVYEDHLSAVAKTTEKKGQEGVDLALLTDGLAAEREQGITIDVAYRYFSTPNRKFVISDTPGHEQYTRNMVTGASTANLAIILVDARKGLLPQSKRHAFISSLLGIKHIVVAINKMDLVDYSEETFNSIRKDFIEFTKDLEMNDLRFVPMSALKGHNVVNDGKSDMPWYEGETLLQILETVDVVQDKNLDDFRLPVQYVLRPDLDFRGFAGQIASGVIKAGDEVVSLPSNKRSKVKRIVTFDGDLEEAFSPQSVTLVLEDEIDTSRGDVLVKADSVPELKNDFTANVCWMTEQPLKANSRYLIKHTTKKVKAMVTAIDHKFDVINLEKKSADEVNLNEIAQIKIKTLQPIAADYYSNNRLMGSFIIIDELTNNTVGAGMIVN